MIEDLADEGVGVATAKTRLCGEHDAVSKDALNLNSSEPMRNAVPNSGSRWKPSCMPTAAATASCPIGCGMLHWPCPTRHLIA